MTARAVSGSTKQANTSGTRMKANRENERLIEFIKGKVVIFCLLLRVDC
jgi:hypothetical protein